MINQEKILAYAEAFSIEESAQMMFINRETHLKTAYPNMLSGPLLGGFLRMISRMLQPSAILEIGTFTGYSALCLADGLADGGKLHTIERNPEMLSMIKKHLDGHGLGEEIELHLGDALEIIPQIKETIDLAFIDGEKSEYIDYYEALLPRLRKGGIILADNVLWSGKVVDESVDDKDTVSIRRFNTHVQEDDRVTNYLLPIRDGLMIIIKH